MSRNGQRKPPRPRIEVRQSSASPEEAAAIAGAIEQFLRDTAPPPEGAPRVSHWLRTGLFEGAGLDPGAPSPWGDPEPWGAVTMPDEQPRELPPERVAELQESGEAQLVDVRTEAEYEAGHLAGAPRVPFDELSAAAETLDSSKPVVLYCHSGNRSATAAQAFAASGFDAHSMAGGLVAWAERGLPLEPEGGRVVPPRGLPES